MFNKHPLTLAVQAFSRPEPKATPNQIACWKIIMEHRLADLRTSGYKAPPKVELPNY